MTVQAIVLDRFGNEDVLQLRDVQDPVARPGEVVVRVLACGVNHVDLDVRAGTSRFRIDLPRILGREISGEVVDVAPDVTALGVGDRVAAGEMFTSCWRCELCLDGRDNLCWAVDYPGVFRDGGYAQYVALPAASCQRLPESLSHQTSAAAQVTFGTAWHALVRRAAGIAPGQTILVTAAASGVGSAGVQVARLLGMRVFAAVGSAAKADAVRELGVETVFVYGRDPVAAGIRDLTAGRGVDVVLDSVGGDVFREAMTALAHGGRLVLAGAHAGEVVPTDLIEIFRYERAVLGTARATRGEMATVMDHLAAGTLAPVIDRTLPLSEAAAAHRRLAERSAVGKVVLLPWDPAESGGPDDGGGRR